MLIPDHNQWSPHVMQEMFEKDQRLSAGQRTPIGLYMQLDLARRRRHAQGTDQIETFVMRNAGAKHRRLPARGPGALERRNQRKSAFIGENQRRPALTPLFLSAARCSVSSVEWRRHRVPRGAVAVSDNSIPSAVADATPHSDDSALETSPRSRV